MSTSSTSPVSPIAQRDIRSASKPFKREKDHGAKWAHGQRPSPGCYIRYHYPGGEELCGGSDSQRAKFRPQKNNSMAPIESKSHANRTPKFTPSHSYDLGRSSGRIARESDAHFESHDASLSRSLLELLPKHANNEHPAVMTVVDDSETLYSFDNSGPSPDTHGRKVGLEGLVDKAEKKWVSEQTEKIVRGEYEVLDGEGETTVLKKGKRSPKQKAVKHQPAAVKDVVDEDGFELI